MDISALKVILFEQFPKAVGFILTGSQSSSIFFKTISDIDIVVFLPFCSDIHSKHCNYADYKIDFTIVPVFDIENIIINEYFDVKGSFINMITSGIILEDPHHIVNDIKKLIIPLVLKKNNKIIDQYNSLISELKKLKLVLRKKLQDDEKVFILSEFIDTICGIEIIKSTGNVANRLHRVKLLKEYNSSFVTDILKLHNSVSNGGSFEIIKTYISAYEANLKEYTKEYSNVLILDFAIPNFKIETFVKKILPQLYSDLEFKSHYKYFFLSPKKYYRQYKYDISICFRQESSDIINDLIKRIAYQIIGEKEQNLFRFQIINPLNRFKNPKASYVIEELRGGLCELVNNLIINNKLEQIDEIAFFSALYLCSCLYRYLEMSIEDICSLNSFLSKRWLLSLAQQRNAKYYEELIEIERLNVKEYELSYYLKKEKILTTIQKALSIKTNPLQNHVELSLEKVKSYIKQNLLENNLEYVSLYFSDTLLEYIKVKKNKQTKAYLFFAEEILQMLVLKNENKPLCLYFMNMGIMEGFL